VISLLGGPNGLIIYFKLPVAEERAREEAAQADEVIKIDDDESIAEGQGGLTFDDTSEFVRAISYNPAAVKAEQVGPSMTRARSKQPSASRDVSIDRGEAMEEIEAGEVTVKEEEDEEDEGAMLNAIEDAVRATEEAERAAVKQEDQDGVGTSAQQTFSAGMASTLNILRQQGILANPSADQTEREKIQLQRDTWLADHRLKVAQRELDKLNSRGGNKDQATREYENRLREQQEARQNLESFKNYKPDVNIVYYDEFGRALSLKEAWKALSHKFHGKGSGKMKTEKRLQKIKEEKKKEAMASGDTPLSMNKAFQIRQEKAGQAHFVLSVGNRGYVLSPTYDVDFTLMTPCDIYSGQYRRQLNSSTPNHSQRIKQRRSQRRKKLPREMLKHSIRRALSRFLQASRMQIRTSIT
jgi:U4/U6.U5 tri-snRNP-associated protein 1